MDVKLEAAAPAPQVEKVVEAAGPKSPLASKTIQFNIWCVLIVPAIRPFLPKYVQESPYLVDAVTAWFALGNIAMRFMTREAVSLFWRSEVAIVERFFFRRPKNVPDGTAPPPPKT